MLKIVTTSQRKQLVVTTTLFNNNNKNKTKSTVFNGETVDAMIYQTFSIRSTKSRTTHRAFREKKLIPKN
jgi:hypothetical protein